ncbi:Pkinase-domain-containing protein [Morchella conica CCBAS932]|uniref:cyclin-dependent kinase n=1 Tax=Morchella conica CCBAS932 TaxID=1392247 RepID=A0A3N4L6N7_9PEZI|nr:Pkinase-domain-containing protein [Morchella conica CCBAS932]
MENQDSTPRWLSITGKPLPRLDHPNGMPGASYGVVHRAQDHKNNKVVALKQVRIFDSDRGNGIPITALREISILKSLRHNNVVNVLDVAVGTELDDVYMVMEYAEQDLANLLDHARVKYSESEVKCLMKQLLEGLEYLHKHDIIHRDIKMSNLLLTAKGVLKIADFGMAREYSARPLTPGVVTVWYRAPELLLSATRYTSAVDIWSAGCIMGELITQLPLLPGETELEQFALIVKLLGSPSDKIWPKMRLLPGIYDRGRIAPDDVSVGGARGRYVPPPVGAQRENMLERRLVGQTKETIRVINEMLTFDPERRITASDALRERYFTREMPPPQRPELIQTFPEIRNESDIGARKGAEGAGGKRKGKEQGGGYVFDFGDDFGVRKKHRQLERRD